MKLALAVTAGEFSDEDCDLVDFSLMESGRPVTWLGVISRADKPNAGPEMLAKADPLIKRGGVRQVTCQPFVI